VATSEYNAEVRLRFAHPTHSGALDPDADMISGSAGSVEHGARFTLFARVSEGRISELKHRVYGCPHSIAAVSLACEQLLGADRERLATWSWRETEQLLQVPAEKRGRLLVLEDAVRSLAKAWPTP
jgi:NifU-like protein involved in Fe-S cluster formation